MKIADDAQGELRRLQQALDSETGNRINLGQRLSVANKRIDQLMAANSAVEVKLAQAKDALAAAEAERDRLRNAANRVLVMAVDAINTGGRIDFHPDEAREILEAALGDAP